MLILGIESTAHTFGVAILDDTRRGADRVIANVRKMATTEKGGLIPAKVAEHHEEHFDAVLAEAFAKASEKLGLTAKESRATAAKRRDSGAETTGIHTVGGVTPDTKALTTLQGSSQGTAGGLTWKDIGLIAVSDAPGLGHALRIGVAVARVLALRHHIPLVGVNHCIAHLEVASMVTDARDPVLLYCSGANTQVIAYDGGKYRAFGETLDTGIGNFLDTFARELGLGFPGGPQIERLALSYAEAASSGQRRVPPALIDIPYSVKGMDVAFSGILTNIGKKIKASEKTRQENGWSNEALAYAVQEVTFAMLVEVAERAMAHCGKSELVLGGGVACNKRLQEMCRLMCEDRGARCYIPANEFLVDNAAMIAWTGKLMFDAGVQNDPKTLAMKPYERTDAVQITWRSQL